MKEKFEAAWKKSRKYFIIYLVLWFIITIVFVVPLSCSIVDATINGTFSMNEFFIKIGANIANFFGNLGKVFTPAYLPTFWSVLWKYTLIFLVVMVIGIWKAAPKHEYSGIENGSSDWSENGEQYRI